MALARLLNYAEHLRTQLEAVPPAPNAAHSVRMSCSAAEATAVVREVLQPAEPLSAVDVEHVHRVAMAHSRLLQEFADRLAGQGAGWSLQPMQMFAMQAQSAAAASLAVGLMKLCDRGGLPGSLAFRLASTASLAVFHQGASANRWNLHIGHPSYWECVASAIDNWQCSMLDRIAFWLGRVADGQRLQQLYGRTTAATAAAAAWLASAAEAMRAVCQQGVDVMEHHTAFATFCREVLHGGGAPCFAGLRQAVQRSPELQAALGFALSAGLAARLQAMSEDAAAAEDPQAATHIADAGTSLQAADLHPLWLAASSSDGSVQQQQAAVQLLEAAEAALQAAAARPCPSGGAQVVQVEAHLLELLLLPSAARRLASSGSDSDLTPSEPALRARHAVLCAAPTAGAALRAATLPPGHPCFFSGGLRAWCEAVSAVVQGPRRGQQTAEQEHQLSTALAAAVALLRLLPLLDGQQRQLRQLQMTPEQLHRFGKELSAAGAAAVRMLAHVADWAAAWAEAVPAAKPTPALRRLLWQLLATATKVARAAADAWDDPSAAVADPAAAAPSGEGAAPPSEEAAVPAAGAAAAAADEEAGAAGAAGEAAGGSLLAECVAAGLEALSAAAASLQRTADRLWTASGSADAESWRDAHVLALLQLQASLAPLLRSPARLPPREQPIPCGDSFSIANTLLGVAAHNEQLFLARPEAVDALLVAVEDALLQLLPEGTATLREDASPGMTSDLLDSLAEAAQQSPRLAAALLQHGVGNLIGAAAHLADSRWAAAGAAANRAGSAGAAEGTAADCAGSQGAASEGAAAGIGGSVGAAEGAADPTGTENAAAGAAAAPHIEWDQMFGFKCQLVCLALERSLKEALQRHGVGLQVSSGGSSIAREDGSTSSSGAGTSSGSGASSSGDSSGTSGGQTDELRTALAAAKQAADSVRLLEDGGAFTTHNRQLDFGVLTDVAAQLQQVWQLEQPPEQQRAAGLRVAAAAAHRGCANLHCANLGGISEGDSRGKKCRGCESVRYCGEACQRADWREGGHRHVCRLLAQQRQQRREQQRQEQEQHVAAGSSDQP